GGAGFIGSHVADELLARGYAVRALDNLTAQVHGESKRPDYLAADVELQVGDVRDPEAVGRALDGVDSVVHLAARVGVGQSMYEIANYTLANSGGTAVLLETLLDHPVRRLVVASSMSIYGDGAYRNESGELVEPGPRERAQLERGEWEPHGVDGEVIEPVHGRARDLRVALAQRPAATGVRGRAAAPRLRLGPRRGPGVPARARARRGRRAGDQRRQRGERHRARDRGEAGGDSRQADRARGDEALPRRRRPALLRRRLPRRASSRLRAGGAARRRHRRARQVARGAGRDRPRRAGE